MNIKKTTYPEQRFTDHKEWREWLTKQEFDATAKFEADFMRIWSDFKQSIVAARTKKQ